MSLFTRIIGKSEDEDKIGLHLVHCLVSEVANGRLDYSQAADEMNLNYREIQDLIKLLTHLNTVTDKLATSARIFNYLCLGEMQKTKHRDYTDEALFWQMVEAE